MSNEWIIFYFSLNLLIEVAKGIYSLLITHYLLLITCYLLLKSPQSIEGIKGDKFPYYQIIQMLNLCYSI